MLFRDKLPLVSDGDGDGGDGGDGDGVDGDGGA